MLIRSGRDATGGPHSCTAGAPGSCHLERAKSSETRISGFQVRREEQVDGDVAAGEGRRDQEDAGHAAADAG